MDTSLLVMVQVLLWGIVVGLYWFYVTIDARCRVYRKETEEIEERNQEVRWARMGIKRYKVRLVRWDTVQQEAVSEEHAMKLVRDRAGDLDLYREDVLYAEEE